MTILDLLRIRLVLSVLRTAVAGVAQLVEQLICNQQVGGSSPFASSLIDFLRAQERRILITIIFIRAGTQVANGGRL